jgi:hypothetical protein
MEFFFVLAICTCGASKFPSATEPGQKKISSYTKSFLRHFSATADFFSQLQEELWPVFTNEVGTSGGLEFVVEAFLLTPIGQFSVDVNTQSLVTSFFGQCPT